MTRRQMNASPAIRKSKTKGGSDDSAVVTPPPSPHPNFSQRIILPSYDRALFVVCFSASNGRFSSDGSGAEVFRKQTEPPSLPNSSGSEERDELPAARRAQREFAEVAIRLRRRATSRRAIRSSPPAPGSRRGEKRGAILFYANDFPKEPQSWSAAMSSRDISLTASVSSIR